MKEENIQCPFCDASPAMRTLSRDREMSFEGVPTTVHNLLYSQCDHCGMQTITPQQTRTNKRTIIEAHKSTLGLLTAAEILQLRHHLSITQMEAAQLFGGGVNAFSKYENSAITQTKAMDNVLRLALEVPGAAEFLATRQGVTLRRGTEKPIRAAKSHRILKNYAQYLSGKIMPELLLTSNPSFATHHHGVSDLFNLYKDISRSIKPSSPHKACKFSQELVAQKMELGNANIKHKVSSRRPAWQTQKQ